LKANVKRAADINAATLCWKAWRQAAKDIFSKSLGNHTVILVSVNHELAGVITFENTLAERRKRTIASLRKLHGIKNIIMITGDNWPDCPDIGRRLGITTRDNSETLPAISYRRSIR